MSLRQGGFAGEVILVGKEPHVPYQRPPLSKQVLKKEWAAERCQLRHLEFYAEHDIDLLLGVAAVRVDPASNTVWLGDGSEWRYSQLAICTGSRLNRLEVSGARLPGVCYLRTIDDSLGLVAQLKGGKRVVIVGGGYIGLEVAAAARQLGCEVTVVEALEQVMKRSAQPEVAAALRQRHEQEGVHFLMGRKLNSIRGQERAEAVELDGGDTVAADVVMVGVGVRPDLRWIEGSGIGTNRGIRVDDRCRSSVENVFAAGDVAESRHPLLPDWHILESVQNAVSQGKVVAANMLGKDEAYTDVPWFWSEQYDCRLQMAGIPRAEDRQVRRENSDTGGFSLFSLSGSRLNAVQSLNSPRDYMVGRQMIAHRTEVAAEQLANQNTNLKDLL